MVSLPDNDLEQGNITKMIGRDLGREKMGVTRLGGDPLSMGKKTMSSNHLEVMSDVSLRTIDISSIENISARGTCQINFEQKSRSAGGARGLGSI